MRRLFALFLSILSVLACVIEMEEVPVEELEKNEMVQVHFSPEVLVTTRSSVFTDEMQINDIYVCAFRNGMIVDEKYTTSLDDLVLKLPVGNSFNVYAVANIGECPSVHTESVFVNDYAYSISDISRLEYGLPMSCVSKNLYVGPSTKSVKLQMERLAAKITLSLDKSSLLNGLHVNSVRLCQSASVVRPFKWEGRGGSRVQSSRETVPGDHATDEDLARLNSGEMVTFYTLENCQGVLLPQNKDPHEKVPDNLGNKYGLCTYLEVSCAFGDEGLFDGGVDYRIYLGLDSTSSFDVPGNSCINVALALTDDGLHDVSWKVDANVSIRNGYALGSVQQGMHQMNGLYVGEKLIYNVALADELIDYLDGNVSGCSLRYVSDGENSDALRVEQMKYDDNALQAELRCLEPSSGELYLYGPDGECLGLLEGVVHIKVPRLVVSESPKWTSSDPVEPMDYMPECEINGFPAEFFVYHVDDEGCNLNCSRSYGFDHSLFKFQYSGAISGSSNISTARSEFENIGDEESGNAAVKFRVFCDNDGDDHSMNLLLADIFNFSQPVYVELTESSFGTAMELSVEMEIPQITMSLVDNGWAKYHDCQLSAIVDNPSNLPLHVNVWQLIAANTNYKAVDESYVENNLILDRMHYMTGVPYNGVPPLFGSNVSFESERNECGSSALEKGDLLVYPLRGISTDDIRKAMYYDKYGNNQMMHFVDVSLNGRKLNAYDIVLEDTVSDGSATYQYMYYSQDSWNYRGASLFSCGEFISNSSSWVYDYPNVNPCSLDGLYGRYSAGLPVTLTYGYNTGSKKVTLATNSVNIANYDMSVSVLFRGAVNGYVQTYPKGTWYAAQDNYCTVEIDHVASGIPLKSNSSYVWADDGIISASIAEIYEYSYLDSPKPLGSDSFMHRAHPVDLDLNVSCFTEGDFKNELLPTSASWKISNIDYYHQQDDTNYKCLLNAEIQEFMITVVRMR